MEKEQKQTKKTNKVIASILSIICIFIAITTVIYLITKYNDMDYELEEITTFSYFKLYENEKYGVIDSTANILIEPKYDNIDIPNPTKPVFIVYSNYNDEEGKYETQVINDKNEKILTQYNEVLPLMFKETNTEIPYEKTVLSYKENDKYGIIDFEGKKITDAVYDSIESLLYKEGCLLVKQNDKYGIINIKGKEVIKTEYDSIVADGYYDEITKYKNAGFIVGKRQDEGYRYGYINNKGKILLETIYNELHRVTEITNDNQIYLLAFKNGLAGIYKNKSQVIEHIYEEIEYNSQNNLFVVQKSSKQGVIDDKGNKILDIEYDYIMISGNKINAKKDNIIRIFDINGKEEEYNNETILAIEDEQYFITINKEDKFGVLDANGNRLIGNEYSYIEYAFDDCFIATKDNKVGIIDKNGNQKIDFKYNVIQRIEDTKVLQGILENQEIHLYNSNLDKTLELNDASIKVENNNIKILTETKREYLDENGNRLENKDIFKDSSLLSYEENGKWGFKDKEGNVKVEAIYDMVTELNPYGYAAVKKDDKWGVINEEGKIIVEPSYKIEWDEPEFIGPYIKLNFGYGLVYYTKYLNNG